MLVFWFVQSTEGGKQEGSAAFAHQIAPAWSSTVMSVSLCKTASNSFNQSCSIFQSCGPLSEKP